jgi:hypothetical protein
MATRGLTLLFDEHFSHKHVAFVNDESKLALMHHTRSVGWSGRADSFWIPLAVRSRFVIVSADRNEKTRGYTVTDLKSMNARLPMVSEFWDHMRVWEKAKWLVASIEDIVAKASIMADGTVELLYKDGSTRPL